LGSSYKQIDRGDVVKIAYFSPVSPQRSGIADYSEKEVLPYLSEYADIDIFVDDGVSPSNKFIQENFKVLSYQEYTKKNRRYDMSLYHMGNNDLHEYIYNTLIKYPGICVFHDIYLHGFLWSSTIARKDQARYVEEFRYCYGEQGEAIAKNAITGGIYPEFNYPLIKRMIDNSVGIMCHSEFAVGKVLSEGSPLSMCKIDQPITSSNIFKNSLSEDKDQLKQKLGLGNKHPIITSFGFISSHKRYHILLNAFKEFLIDQPNSVLILIGDDLVGIDKLISNLELKKQVIKTGYISYKMLVQYLTVSDFCINLRYPTAGETSRSVLQIMAAEKPVIVSNVGWFSEIPDNCCLKVDVDSYEEDILLEYMKLLASDERLRKQIGKNAREYVQKEHDPKKIARELYIFIKNVLDGREYILNKVSKELAYMGVKEEDTEIISHLSKRISSII
jgi:glycosyltransferase involved in cell wall biosynthesis